MKKTKKLNKKLSVFDNAKLPEKYFFRNEESLTDNKYIDDNSLFVCHLISRGIFCANPETKRDAGTIFLYYHPFEWTSIDFVSFLLSVSKKYDLELEGIETYLGAVEDEYETSYEPREYEGAYKWILELQEKEPNREEVILFNKFADNKATVSDIERALIYADRLAPMYKGGENSESFLSKDLFIRILDYSHFSFSHESVKKSKIIRDIDIYLEAFMQEKLIRNNKSKMICGTYVSQSQNIYTFKKHSSLFREYLQKMQNDYGNIFMIQDIFEEGLSNEYPKKDVIRNRYSERNLFFWHILFAFHKQGFLKLLSAGSNWDLYEDKKQSYQAKIELLPAFFNEDSSKKLYFDPDKSRFYVQGKEIKLLKFKDEYHVLRVMFENPEELSREWFFSEIREAVDGAKKDDKKYYNAIYQIKLKLEKEGIKDFFITTKQSVIINKKYLS